MANINIGASGSVLVGNKDKVLINTSGGGTVNIAADPGATVGKLTIDLQSNDAQTDVVNVDLSTFNQDGLHLDIKNYDPTDQINLVGVSITGLQPGSTSKLEFTYVGSDGLTHTGYAHLKDKGQRDFTAATKPIVICFVAGTRIRTPDGDTLIEDIAVGDLVETRDHGPQTVRWIGGRVVTPLEVAANPGIRPITIKRNALGLNRPSRDLRVSPQHRIVMENSHAQLLFGESDVLVAARYLVNDLTIRPETMPGDFTYYHMLFDRHEVVFADDLPSESLHPGDEALNALDKSARREVLDLFPETKGFTIRARKTARRVLRSYEARVLNAYVGKGPASAPKSQILADAAH